MSPKLRQRVAGFVPANCQLLIANCCQLLIAICQLLFAFCQRSDATPSLRTGENIAHIQGRCNSERCDSFLFFRSVRNSHPAGGPGFQIPPSVPREDIGCPILCAESRGRFSREIRSAQRVGDNYSPTLTRPFFAQPVMSKAAPGPELGRFCQSSPHRVGVYVVQLLNVLLFRSNIEVIRPGLPECGRQLFTKNIRGFFLCAALERNTLLQHLHNPGGILNFWFADQKVDVLRHDHVAGYDKLIFLACLLKDFKEHITVPG